MNLLEALRLLVGIPLVLLVPGWVWSLAFFPWQGRSHAGTDPGNDGRQAPSGIALLERVVVALALSIALVPLAALAWSAGLGLPLGTGGSLAVIGLVTGAGALTGWLRRRKAGHQVN